MTAKRPGYEAGHAAIVTNLHTLIRSLEKLKLTRAHQGGRPVCYYSIC